MTSNEAPAGHDAAEADANAVAATVEEMRRSGAGAHALKVGDVFPDFLLPDAEGRLVERADLIAEGPAVVTFYRGDWCRTCTEALAQLEAAAGEVQAAGATLTAIAPETAGRALAAKQHHCLGFRLLADVDHGLAMACGLAFRVPQPYRGLLRRAGVDLAERQGNAGWFLPLPATFVLDRAGIVHWSFVNLDFGKRADPAEIVAAIRSLPPR
jgi:peroxiredoxin